MILVGIDWAKQSHFVVVTDLQGTVLAQRRVPHRAASLGELAALLASYEPDPAAVAVAMEAHDGALLSWLLEAGYTVYAINPKSSKRAREFYRPGGGKDDRRDALVLADILRHDRQRFHPVRPQSDQTRELAAWARLRWTSVTDATALEQRLRALLDQWAPELSALLDDLGRRWQRDLLARCPLESDLIKQHGNALNAFYKAHRLRQSTRERIQEARRQAPFPVPEPCAEPLRTEIRSLIQRLETLDQSIAQANERLKELVAAHPDVEIFRSLPVKAAPTIAILMAAFGQDRDDPAGWEERARLWGVAPITIQSGIHRSAHVRRGCDELARHGLLFFALATIRDQDCWACAHYRAKRAAGKGHFTALRHVANRWVKIIHAIWRDKTPYDEARFVAAREHTHRRAA